MAFIGPLDAFNSEPIQTTVPNLTTPLFTATSTKVTKDSSGKVTGGITTLYYSATAGNYVPAATTTDGGKTWTYLKDSNGKEILGADGKKSLEQGSLKTNTQQQILAATKQKPLGGGLSPEEQKMVAASAQNTATNADQSGNQEGSSSEDIEKGIGSFNQDGLNQQVSDGGLRQTYTGGKGPGGAYMYPINMDKTQDKIKITMYRYAPKKIDVSNIAVGAGFSGGNVSTNNKGQKIVMGTAILPIQPQISDSNGVVWGEDSLNSIEAMAASAALGAIQGGGESITSTVEGITSLIKGKAKGDIKAGMAAFLAGNAAGANKSFFTRATGGILNPNLELLFQGPTLRSFTFNFVMSAREKAEAEEIRNIIRFFKQGMSVKRSSSNLFLKTPNVFDISYIYGGDGNEHPWINKIKTCALQNCVVNYTPDGNYATFKDGPMTQYQMSLTFGEIDPIYDDDYGTDDSTTNIGY
jgi:hypothetical protein